MTRAALAVALVGLLLPGVADAGKGKRRHKHRSAEKVSKTKAKAKAKETPGELAVAIDATADATEPTPTIDMEEHVDAPPAQLADSKDEHDDETASDADADADADAGKAAEPEPEPSTEASTDKPEATVEAAAPETAKPLEISGYLQPALDLVYRGAAVPRDRLRYGADSTRAGIIFSGTPVKRWSYHLEVVLAGETNDLVTEVNTVDTNGDGVPDDVAPMTEKIPGIYVERAVLEFDAGSGFSVVAGQHRIPFTVQEQSPSTQLMFPTRSGPNEVFVQGPDLGVEAVYKAPGDKVIAQVGGFNGTGEPVGMTDVHGLVYSARLDVNPLGEFPVSETAKTDSPRVGVGAGILYYSSRHYDAAGFPGAQERDLRASASVRVAAGGLYAQSEVLRRQRTDSLSSRPEITTGAYAQASFYTAASIGLAPLARLGWAAEDQGFATRTTLWFEAGLAVYPSVANPDALKIVVEYLGERRVSEAEQANGAVLQAQLVW